MKKRLGVVPALFSFLLAVLLFAGCAAPQSEGVSIYLTSREIPVAAMPMQSHVEIAAQPTVAPDEIISYKRETHEIELTPSAYERITEMDVPVSGRSFVVCVNRSPIYWGAFWTPLSSLSFDGIVIMKPLALERNDHIIRLEAGYPSPQFFTGEDTRLNAQVMQALEQAGKLK
ncbi:MAG: hypothetical protein ABIB93_08320 [Chloroflexota bacterium]